MNRKKYAFLEGMRGIAAFLIILRHVSCGVPYNNPFYRSYLGVDLFFLLSGFVIAYAYDERLAQGQMSCKEFILRRLIRLYPIFIISWAGCMMADFIRGYPDKAELMMSGVLAFFFIPYHTAQTKSFFPLNLVYWTLFFEIIANLFYAFLRPVLSQRLLIALLIVAGGFLVWGALLENKNLDGGSRWGVFSLMLGFARAMFGMCMGLMIFRLRDKLSGPVWLGWVNLCAVIFVLTLPQLHHRNGFIDVLAVLVIFPGCVFFSLQTAPTRAAGLLSLLGACSYPLYVLHVPVYELFFYAVHRHDCPPLLLAGLCTVLIVVSALLNYYYDVPARNWLQRKLLKSANARACAGSL